MGKEERAEEEMNSEAGLRNNQEEGKSGKKGNGKKGEEKKKKEKNRKER